MRKRLAVRLDEHLSDVLARRCAQTGQTTSQIVRQALEFTLVSDDPESTPVAASESPKTPNPSYVFPRKLAGLLPFYRQLGAAVWQERRIRLQGLLALFEIARENSQNPQDTALCTELLSLGRRYGLLDER